MCLKDTIAYHEHTKHNISINVFHLNTNVYKYIISCKDYVYDIIVVYCVLF